jgi:hypothetical protein
MLLKITTTGRKLAVVAAMIVLVIFAINRAFAWGTCSWYGHETSRDTRYSPFLGCMVKVNTSWVPRNELRVVQ